MKHIIRLLFITLLTTTLNAWQLPANCQQAIIGVANDWDSSSVTLGLYEKRNGKWTQVGKSWNGRLGKSGLSWGLGIHPFFNKPHLKKEGDNRAPAGVFQIGGAYGIHPAIQKSANLSYTRVTTRDLWVEDSSSPYYNRHIKLSHEPNATWEKQAQMRQNDYPHSLKLFIGHNAATAQQRATPNAGSSIFFHIWRHEGKSPSAGCTTMHESHLRWLISKIDPAKSPLYILLPRPTYSALRNEWKLP